MNFCLWKGAVTFADFIPVVHTAFLLISAEMNFSKQNKALLLLILNIFQSWSSRPNVNLCTVLSKFPSLSVQLCLSQALEEPVCYFTACSASLTVAGRGETQEKESGFSIPNPGQVLIKFRQSRAKVSVLQLQHWRPPLLQQEHPYTLAKVLQRIIFLHTALQL